MRFAIKTMPQHCSWAEMLALWRAADDEPLFESAWTFDHFYPIYGDWQGPCLEGWTTLAALAQATSRLRVGVMVTGVIYRHPAVVANMAAAVDLISDGRLELGLGAGWNDRECQAYGIELGSLSERFDRFGEACEVITGLLGQTSCSFDGRYYHLVDARCEPKGPQRPHPPICIGGGGERRTLPLAARFAQHWNFPGGSTEDFARKRDLLAACCVDIGRDPADITTSTHLLAWPDKSVADVVAQAEAYTACGLDLGIVYLEPPFNPAIVAELARALAPPRDVLMRPVLCWATGQTDRSWGRGLVDLITLASRSGYGGITVTPSMYAEAAAAGLSDAHMRARLDDAGVVVSVIDPLLAGLPGCPEPASVAPRFRSTFEHGEADCFQAALALGAPMVNVAHYMGRPTPLGELADALGGICTRARAEGLGICVEFMPEGSISDLATTLALLGQLEPGAATVMLDTWHFFRTGGTPADLAGLVPGTIGGVQVSDADAGLFNVGVEARVDQRLLPGQGAIPLTEILARVRAGSGEIDLGVEIFVSDLPALDMARACLTALRSVVAGT